MEEAYFFEDLLDMCEKMSEDVLKVDCPYIMDCSRKGFVLILGKLTGYEDERRAMDALDLCGDASVVWSQAKADALACVLGCESLSISEDKFARLNSVDSRTDLAEVVRVAGEMLGLTPPVGCFLAQSAFRKKGIRFAVPLTNGTQTFGDSFRLYHDGGELDIFAAECLFCAFQRVARAAGEDVFYLLPARNEGEKMADVVADLPWWSSADRRRLESLSEQAVVRLAPDAPAADSESLEWILRLNDAEEVQGNEQRTTTASFVRAIQKFRDITRVRSGPAEKWFYAAWSALTSESVCENLSYVSSDGNMGAKTVAGIANVVLSMHRIFYKAPECKTLWDVAKLAGDVSGRILCDRPCPYDNFAIAILTAEAVLEECGVGFVPFRTGPARFAFVVDRTFLCANTDYTALLVMDMLGRLDKSEHLRVFHG